MILWYMFDLILCGFLINCKAAFNNSNEQLKYFHNISILLRVSAGAPNDNKIDFKTVCE